MAINKFSKTTMLMTEYVPNISIPQNRVNILMPSSSKLSKSTKPNTAQNKVCVVSNKLKIQLKNECQKEHTSIQCNHTLRIVSIQCCKIDLVQFQKVPQQN